MSIKEEIKKEISKIVEKYLDLAPDLYTSPVTDCQHKFWGLHKGMLRKTTIHCTECKFEIDDPKTIDFIEKVINNDKETIRNVFKRIDFLLEDKFNN